MRPKPDLAYCGGPTETLKIRSLASSLGINVVPHCWGTQLNLASAAHFIATTSVEPGRAEVCAPLLETDLTRNPMQDEMFSQAVSISGGVTTVPNSPGLGVEVDQKAMESLRVQFTERN